MVAPSFDRRLKSVILACVALIFLVLVLLRAVDLAQRREQTIQDAERRASNRCRILAEYVHEVFAVTDTSLRQLAVLSPRLGGAAGSREDWQDVLKAAAAGLTGIGSLSITDSQGVIRHSTLEEIIGQSRSDDYLFQQLAARSHDDLIASRPFVTVVPPIRVVIPLGRRLAPIGGKFDGIIVATFIPEELRSFFQSMLVGKKDEAWLFHPSGLVLYHEPSASNPIGDDAAVNPIFQEAMRKNAPGTIRGRIVTHGSEMLTAFYSIPEPQLLVAISLAQDEVLTEWRFEAVTSTVAFVVIGLMLIGMLFVLFRQIDARSGAESALQVESLRRERESAVAREARNLAAARSAFADELERKNKELEAFSYSVSHDLRAPLRSIDGFSQLLLDEHSGSLDGKGREYLQIVRDNARRMGELIDDLLKLARVSRAEIHRLRVDLSEMASAIAASLNKENAGRKVEFIIQERLEVQADASLIRIVMENLIGNAWKFSSQTESARIEFGAVPAAEVPTFFVRDNGAGFNMKYSNKLFRPFQRLHRQSEFAGTGIGLATVHRVIDRHGGRIWAESTLGKGAIFFFTIPTTNPLE